MIGPMVTGSAQQRPGPKPRQHTNRPPSWNASPSPLNKGRDRSPGNTRVPVARRGPHETRSTKAGTEAPATHPQIQGARIPPGARSTKAGTEAPATPEVARPQVFDEVRSTKAGTEAPATPPTARERHLPGNTSLNKGRDRSPGNTWSMRSCATRPGVAQQRPGPKPRQHGYRRSCSNGSWSRSTKAGTEAPATQLHTEKRATMPKALNKGRDRSPGNTGVVSGRGGPVGVAQQRPGPKPRQHGRRSWSPPSAKTAQQRPGPKPRQHPGLAALHVFSNAQQRPGPKPRQHRPPRTSTRASGGAQQRPGPKPRQHLEETPHTPPEGTAQQRPGPKPRQHSGGEAGRLARGRRSTKAGTEAPATPISSWMGWDISVSAQQRPGPKPRQHQHQDLAGPRDRRRSTKAGTEAPATPELESPRARPGLRSTKAGTEAPATLVVDLAPDVEGVGAQQRPGPKPRQHSELPADHATDNVLAQQRPGPKPRQHGSELAGLVLGPERSTKAGTEAPATQSGADNTPAGTNRAQQRPGPKPRQHVDSASGAARHPRRSTKAGTEAPATPSAPAATATLALGVAQQRPGPKPRQHVQVGVGPAAVHLRSTKAGTEAPATRGSESSSLSSCTSAQQRPGPKPRQHDPKHVSWIRSDCAQQRPGPKPRQHGRPTRRPSSPASSLNKGRDRSPGNTFNRSGHQAWSCSAQQRPGPKPRQHARTRIPPSSRASLNKGRDRSPGNTPSAQRRPARFRARSTKAGTEAPATPDEQVLEGVREQARSTKAGTEAPATRRRRDGGAGVVAPLNKGRDRSPGNT